MTAWQLLLKTCAAAPMRGVLVCEMPGCGVEFTKRAPNQRFCCEKHARLYHEKHARSMNRTTRKEA